MYTICSLFAICSFFDPGTGLFRPLVAEFEFRSGLVSRIALQPGNELAVLFEPAGIGVCNTFNAHLYAFAANEPMKTGNHVRNLRTRLFAE